MIIAFFTMTSCMVEELQLHRLTDRELAAQRSAAATESIRAVSSARAVRREER